MPIEFGELWRYRDLFAALAVRDLAVRYKQTLLGAAWAILQPLVTMVIFTFVFNGMGKIDSGDGTPYPIFLYVGLLLWQFYANTLTNASASMIGNAGLIQKVYFPRLMIPATAATTGLVDLLIASLILVGMMLFYRFHPSPAGLLLLPLLILSTLLLTVGIGLFLAALNVKYRDVRYAAPFFIQTMMYLTPVIYPVKMLDHHAVAKTLMVWCNPMAGIITAARASILGKSSVDWSILGVSLLMSVAFFIFGVCYFRNSERHFADIV